MTGLLIFGGTILLVVLAVTRYERRFARAPQPWSEAVVDRDTQRMQTEAGSLIAAYNYDRPRVSAPARRRSAV